MVFDNAFDEGLEKGLLQLSRLAFEFHHHVIVIMQSREMAIEVDKVNGARTRLATTRQQGTGLSVVGAPRPSIPELHGHD